MALKRTRRSRVIFLLALILLGLAAVGFHRAILTAAGHWLLAADPLQKSDAALVLSGEDGDGLRTRAAVDLYKQGWVKTVVLSGAHEAFRHYETDYSGPLALSLGVPEKDLMILPHRARSTLEEAKATVPDMERAGIRSMILVTSNFHTHRAKRYFERVCKDRIRVIAFPANNDFFSPDDWWKSREGLKYFFFEAMKSWTSYLE